MSETVLGLLEVLDRDSDLNYNGSRCKRLYAHLQRDACV